MDPLMEACDASLAECSEEMVFGRTKGLHEVTSNATYKGEEKLRENSPEALIGYRRLFWQNKECARHHVNSGPVKVKMGPRE